GARWPPVTTYTASPLGLAGCCHTESPQDHCMKRCVSALRRPYLVPKWWESLFNASRSRSIFLSASWIQTWLEIYGDDFEGVWVHWEMQGAVVGGGLLLERVVRVKNIPFRSIFLNATGVAAQPTPLAEFNDILHIEAYRTQIADDLARMIHEKSWDKLLVSGFEEGSVCARVVALLQAAAVERDSRPAPYVDFSALGDLPYEKSLTGSTGTQVRRHKRQYE